MARLKIDIKEVPDRKDALHVILDGGIDAKTRDELEGWLTGHLKKGTINFILDMDKVKSVNGAGLETLVALFDHCKPKGGGVVLIHVDPKLKTVLNILSITDFFIIRKSLKEGIDSLPSSSDGDSTRRRKKAPAEPEGLMSGEVWEPSEESLPPCSDFAYRTPSANGERTDPVDCTVFSPTAAAPGASFMIQVFVHPPEEAVKAAKAPKVDGFKPREFSSLEMDVAPKTGLTLRLTVPGGKVVGPNPQTFQWTGKTTSISFGIQAPFKSPGPILPGRVEVLQGDRSVGDVRFGLRITRRLKEPERDLRPTGTGTLL